MPASAEFTVEPFVPGDPGPHVTAAIDAARATGAAVEVGPFATAVSDADQERVLAAVDAALRAALRNGASRVSVQVSVQVSAG